MTGWPTCRRRSPAARSPAESEARKLASPIRSGALRRRYLMKLLTSGCGVFAALALICIAVGQEKDRPEPDQVKKPLAIVKGPGHTLHVALTANGKIVARAGDHLVDLWDVASGKKLHTLKGYTAPIWKVAFSPDGKTLASIGGGPGPDESPGEVKLWDVATGKERVPVKGHPHGAKGHPHGVGSLAFSADGQTLATSAGKSDGEGPASVKLWDVATGKEKMELGVAALSLAFSPDGKTLAMGVGGDEKTKQPGSVQLWDLTTGKKRASMPGHDAGDWAVGFTPDGKTLVSAGWHEKGQPAGSLVFSRNPRLKVWDVATARERANIAIPGGYAWLTFFPLVFTADSNTLISAT